LLFYISWIDESTNPHIPLTLLVKGDTFATSLKQLEGHIDLRSTLYTFTIQSHHLHQRGCVEGGVLQLANGEPTYYEPRSVFDSPRDTDVHTHKDIMNPQVV
jgi:hypothetical protein